MSLASLVLAGFSVPMILRKVPPNPTYGFRTRLTLSSPEVWYPANAFSGWTLLIAALIDFALIWLVPPALFAVWWVPLAAFAVPVGLSALASLIYLRRFRKAG
jgi:hypothetical protein